MIPFDDLNKQLAVLSPAKRALLERRRKRAAAVSSIAPAIRPRKSHDGSPLSFTQQRLWLINQLDPESYLYNVPRAVRMKGPLDIQALERSLNEIVRRHEVLRTTFIAEAGEPVQKITPVLQIALPVTDISGIQEDERATEAQRRAVDEIRCPFDLCRGPLLRTRLLRLGDGDHVLVVAMHHIVSDGWTGALFFDELGSLYRAFSTGQPSPLPELPVQYSDYAVWQRESMQDSILEKELAYWRTELEGAPPLLELPSDRLRPHAASYRGRRQSRLLAEQVCDDLKAFSQRQGVTLFTTMLTALEIVLSRWSGQDDLVIGTVSANRNRTEIENLMGCFMNFLPLRGKVKLKETGLELLSRVKQTVLGGFEHQDCPFEKIIEAVNPERSLNVNPLYNVALLMQNYPQIAFSSDQLQAQFLSLDTEIAFLDLRFGAGETAQGLQIDCEYNTDLFDRGTIEHVINAYADVLEQLAAQPQMQVSEFRLPDGLIRQAVNAKKRDHKQTIAVAATFTAEPLQESLAFWMQQLGMRSEIEFAPYNQVFQQLLDPSSLLAQNRGGFNVVLVRMEDWERFDTDRNSGAIAREKIERNLRELVRTVRSAAQRAGSPYLICICPPSQAMTADTTSANFHQSMETLLRSELNDTSGVHVTTSSQLLDLYPVSNYEDEYADKLGHIAYTPELFSALGTMIARRIHGIRSAPYKVIALDCDNTLWKGVCGEEGPLGIEVDAPRRALQEFMIAQQNAGMVLCLCSKNAEEDVDAVFEHNPNMLLRREQIVGSKINWQPKSENLKELARELQLGLDSFIFVDDNPLECAEVQANCPEVLTLQLPRQPEQIATFLRHAWAFDHGKVTAEDLQRTSLYRQNIKREQLRKGSTSLANFLAGLQLEIDIRPMQTADLSRVAQLLERTNQFNFTTIRRSESEIEKLGQSGAECLVVDLRDRFGDYGLAGVVIFTREREAISVDSFLLSCRTLGRRVEHHILGKLGEIALEGGLLRVDAMYVSTSKNRPAWHFLESVGSQFKETLADRVVYRFPARYAAHAAKREEPETAIARSSDERSQARAASHDPAQTLVLARIAAELFEARAITRAIEAQKVLRRRSPGVFLAPRTPTEEILAGIWMSLLRIEKIGVNDNFFSFGGHSLLATQVVARIRRTLGVELPLRAMFEAPTIAELAARVEAANRADIIAIPPPSKAAEEKTFPLSFAQQRLWFLDQLDPANPLYNLPQMIRMRGELDVEALQQSINEIVRRHESLRTTFTTVNNQPVQVIAAERKLTLPIVDLCSFDADKREAEAGRLAREDALKPFDLSKGPLLRATLLRLGLRDYALLLNVHHVISDRWSMGLLAEEMAALYGAFAQDKPSPLADLALQYVDYAIWQRHWLEGEVLDKQLAYWKKQLSGAPDVLDLPTDRQRPAVQSYRGSTQARLVPKRLVEKLTALSQSEGVTLFMTLLAAFQTLLRRYSAQEDVVVGSPIANRNYAEIEPLIGFFVNTLAFRTDLSGDPNFRDLLGRVKEVSLGAYAHQDIPFERLVEELQPERSLSHNPIFQVMFALQNAPMQELELPGIRLERTPIYTGTSMFDMSWFAIAVPEGLLMRCEYNTDLFDDSTIARWLGHFLNLLEGAAAHPELCLSELPLLEDAERRKVLMEFNATEADYPKGLCVHSFLEQKAENSPDAIALISDLGRISYRDLNARANQIAHFLLKRGVGPDVLVGIFTERNLDMVAGILGILKAGGAYVPLDPAYPTERLGYILEDAKAHIVLTQNSLVHKLPKCASEFICLDADWDAISRESPANPVTNVKPENLGYVLFTSGSTGRPKGVALEHRSAVTFIQWANSVFASQELSGVLFSTSICFDMSVFEMFVTLSAGGKIILAQNALYLPTLPAKNEVTLINTVPSAIAELVRMKGIPQSVKVVNLAGEALPDALVEQIYSSTAVDKVYNLYGPTEDTTSTYTLVPRGAAVTVGIPLANTQAYILDAHRQPLPVGVPGELYVAGGGLARGYYGRPDLTAERFVHNPFSAQKGARMYRTGDLCRWMPDGNIQYLGRIDHQVKLRGFRIELGEVETVLTKHPGVRQTLVMAREDDPGLKQLVAYIVPNSNSAPQTQELRNHVAASLPEFMIPAAFVILDAFPLTPNGKVNRKALPAPEFSRGEDTTYVGPRTPAEESVVAVWTEVLHVPQISVHDNFFALGGHSLLATQVISRLRQAFGIDLPLRTIFEAPTAAALAVRIQGAQREYAMPPIERVSREHALPASFAQQRLWFLDQLEPNNPLYNIPWTMRVSGALNVEALERALNLVVERHESLRTTFSTEDDQPVQIIHPWLHLPLLVIDLTRLQESEREPEARRLIAEEARRPFDLGVGPLLRATLLGMGTEEHFLLINIHHIISDRWSMGVLSQELATLYDAMLEGRPSPLPELPIQYPDFAVWQRKWLAGEVLEKQLAYWKEQLKDASPVLELPTDRPRLAAESFRGEIATITLSKEVTEKLNGLSRSEGATLFMTLLAGFQALLSRYSRQDDILVGMAIANRNLPEVENLIGFFVNTLPLRTKLSGDPSFREIISRVKEVALGAYAHQDIPFEKLVEELRPERSLSHNPLVQVFFVLQNALMEALQLRDLKLKPIRSGTKTAKGDMYLSMLESPEGLQANLEYNTDLFDGSTIERLLEHYGVLLEAAVADPELRLSELPLLASTERQRLLVDWNATEFDYPRNLCLHQLFEQQVERTPEAVACVLPVESGARRGEEEEDQQLTYGELNARANQVGHYLKQRGMGPGQRVGIFVERSLQMMVALLGIQKSGAAYVPLDPAYPAERVRLTLEDAQVAILLTQQSLLAALPGHQAEVVCLDADGGKIAQQSRNNFASGATPEDLVYVIFTSGSTGRPKGVQVPHRAVVNLLSFMAEELRMGPGDVFPALASFAFDMCIPELYLGLVTGGRVVVGDRHLAANGEELARLLRRTGATIIHATPTTWKLLLEAGFSGQGLKRVIGAEPLPRELGTRLLEADASLYNFYGPTETTVWSAFHHFRTKDEPIVIGRPLANTQIYILDQNLQPTPIGVPGEIHIGGHGVTRGYLNRAELTGEQFIADPFSPQANAKLYKTGDRGRYLADGRIEFQGRTDNQVKVRGYRIELGEIEAVLGKHSSVQECAILAREDVPGDKRLVGYVVPATGQAIDVSALRGWIKERLPEYMVPLAFVEMRRLPLSPNGKVDRKNLPAPDYSRREQAREYEGARTPGEEVMANIWAEVLHLDQVGIDDDFFELGGHSLLATQAVSRIRQAFHVELPLRALFEAPTVSGLAERVAALQRQKQGLEAPPLEPVSRDQALPLSFAQQRLWFLDQLEPNNPLYNVAHIVRMRGALNAAALEKSLNEIVRRHEALRTTFQIANDQPMQVIAPTLRVPLAATDLTFLPEAEREGEARKLAMEEVKRPFQLSTGPLLRALLVKIADEDHAFILNTHHIVSDRWSLGVLSHELAVLYEAYLHNQPSPLAELPIQYADYSVWQRQFLSGKILENHLAYWREQLHGAPPVLDLPTDRPRQAAENFWGAQYRQALSEDLIENLRTLGRRHSVTFFMTLLAAFQVLLARSSGQNDVVVGTDLANRTQLDTEKLIGFFVNLLPVRTRLSGDPSFEEVLKQVREVSLGAFAHQDVPFDKLVEELRPERSLSHTPLVQVLFVMQNTPPMFREFGGLRLGPLGVSSASRFDIVLFINNPDDAPSATWMYNPNLFDGATIVRMTKLYELLLRSVVAHPEIRLSSLKGILAEAEKQQRGTEHKEFREASQRKLKKTKRKTIT